MDYKEKYEEVLKKARKELQACGSTDCDAARQIFRLFPELKESDDEQIGKEIVYFLSRNTFQFGEDINKYKSWVAWLEKQGEQKSEEVDNLHNYLYGEQESSEWSDEDEAVLDALIRRLEGEDIHVSPHLAVKCLKSLKDRYTWEPSNEQIMALRWVLNHIPYDSHKEEISGLLEQLKKLKG